jgi:hypothetical protein
MGWGSVGVLLVVLPRHLADIQFRSAVKRRCIISGFIRPEVGLMTLAKPVLPDAAGPRLTALTFEQAADLLRRAGSQRVTVAALRADLEAGAPVNADGTLNLLAYGAWLVRALATRESAHGG